MIDQVFEIGLEVVKEIQNTQKDNLYEAAKLISNSFIQQHHFFVSGSGHSHTVAEEFYGRAGGLAFAIPILTTELTLTEHPTKSSYIERLDGYATILAELYNIQKGDVVLIASNSGRNAYPVELALEAKKRGAKVIAITSLKHSKRVTPRNKSGKLLFEVADVVIDNCGVYGDCKMQLPNFKSSVFPTSSLANAFIVQAITVQCIQNLLDEGIEPPVFISLNVDGTEHVNDEYYRTYTRLYYK